jgi:murein DD-endopeptidase MepM/ murein hydrolase activator NlpD
MTWIMPFPEKAITGEYGTMSEYRRKNNMQAHSGTDWAPAGSNKGKTPVPAVARGTVKLVQWSNVLGWVLVQSAMDKDKKVWYIGYCHLKDEPKLKVGDKLAAGDAVGIMGTTGSASSGIHLHATASSTVKGVFGPTSIKVDLKKLILANQGAAPAPKATAPAPKARAPRAAAPKTVKGK